MEFQRAPHLNKDSFLLLLVALIGLTEECLQLMLLAKSFLPPTGLCFKSGDWNIPAFMLMGFFCLSTDSKISLSFLSRIFCPRHLLHSQPWWNTQQWQMKCPSLIATHTTSPWRRPGRQQWTVFTTQALVEGGGTKSTTTYLINIPKKKQIQIIYTYFSSRNVTSKSLNWLGS